MRVIVEVLLNNDRLVKGMRFKNHIYVGDPENIIRLYNELKIDELVICQIGTLSPAENKRFLMRLSEQAFMPVCYAGNLKSVEDIDEIFSMGFDKIRFTSALYFNTRLIEYTIDRYGRQAVVLGIDLISSLWRSVLRARVCNKKNIKLVSFQELLDLSISFNPCEILIRSVDEEGMMSGLNKAVVDICSRASQSRSIIYSGGIKSFSDILAIKSLGFAGVAIGAMSIFHGRKRGILVSYPTDSQMKGLRDGWKK